MESEQYRIGILSDTHGLLRADVKEALAGCRAIFHAGDVGRQEILDELARIAPVYAVRGNADGDWAGHLPESRMVTLFGLTFFLIHNRKKITEEISGADAVIFGHTHRFEENFEGNKDGGRRLWLNPGSCGPKRFIQPVTMAFLETDGRGTIRVEKREFSAQTASARQTPPAAGKGTGSEEDIRIPADIGTRIPGVIRDMNRGLPMEQIAGRAGISRDLAEQICRMYVTHPGVDVDGILRRLGL